MIKEFLLTYIAMTTALIPNQVPERQILKQQNEQHLIVGGLDKIIYDEQRYVGTVLDYEKMITMSNYYSVYNEEIIIETEIYLYCNNNDDQVTITGDYYLNHFIDIDISLINCDSIQIDCYTEYIDWYEGNDLHMYVDAELYYEIFISNNDGTDQTYTSSQRIYIARQSEQGFVYRGNGYAYVNYQSNYGYLLIDGFPYLTQDAYYSGFNNGYTNGFNDGYIDGANQNNDIFSMIGNAFNGVINLFNIEIIPGINLGLLIFAPLFIGVVLLLLKLVVK